MSSEIDAVIGHAWARQSAQIDPRRVAACWNACTGLSTEALERLGTLDRAMVERDVIHGRTVKRLADLLEFAEEVRRSGDTRLASMAIAVIAKATGEAA